MNTQQNAPRYAVHLAREQADEVQEWVPDTLRGGDALLAFERAFDDLLLAFWQQAWRHLQARGGDDQ